MKVEMGKIPITISLDAPKVGDVLRAKGGRGDTRFWLVAAVANQTAHVLGLDREGNIVSTASYGVHALAGREIVGAVEDFAEMRLNIKWETV
ncbi:hypothetical protein [Cupriavidus basilensis]|uniref:hypothetical protein n=1 Tax=Cupriavidus basilensis TaxID=68895 RepID=UPI0005BD33CF|nr:hypothetical protein [Cupriavidus basilensis]